MEEEKNLTDLLSEGIKENSVKVPQAFKKLLRELKLQRDLDTISQQEYYLKLTELRDSYLEKGSVSWWTYTKEIINYNEQQKKDIIALYSAIAAEAGKKMEEIDRLQERMARKLQNYGALFEEISITQNGRTRQFTALGDLSADVGKLEAYQKALEAIRQKGVPPDFVDVFRDMSVEEGISFSQSLLKASPSEFQNYIAAWQKKQQTAAAIASEFYHDETQSVIEELSKSMEQAGLSIPIGFFESGAAAAENFGTGFLERLDAVMEQIRSMLSAGIAGIMPLIAENGGSAANNSYNNIFRIGSVKNTASEQIQAWKAAMQMEKMRGGKG